MTINVSVERCPASPASRPVSTLPLTQAGRSGRTARVRVPIYIEGVALEISFADARRNLSELIFDTVRASVDDSGREMGEIDSVVLAAHDLVDGRSLSSMVTASCRRLLPARRNPVLRRRRRRLRRSRHPHRGQRNQAVHRRCLGRASASTIPRPVRPRPLRSVLRLTPWHGRVACCPRCARSSCIAHAAASGRMGRASHRRGRRCGRNPRALKAGGLHPRRISRWTAADMPLWADIAVSLVLSTEPSAVRVAGIGQSSEPYCSATGTLRSSRSLSEAAERALSRGRCGGHSNST